MENNNKLGKCPLCNEIVTLDSSKKRVDCPKCNKTIEVKDAYANYALFERSQKLQSEDSSKVVIKDVDKLLQQADFELNLNNYAQAKDFYEQVLEQNPSNAMAWFGIVKCQTKRFTDFDAEDCEEEFYKALAFATNKDKENMLEIYDKYINAKQVFETEKQKINVSRIEMFKTARKESLSKDLSKLQSNFQNKIKLETLQNIVLCICCGLLFVLSLIFGGFTIFSNSRSFGGKFAAFFGVCAVCFALGYYVYYRFISIYRIRKLMEAILKQEESISNLSKLIGIRHYQTIQILSKMYYKGFLPNFSIKEQEYLLYGVTFFDFTKSSSNKKSPTKSDTTDMAKETKKEELKDNKPDRKTKTLRKADKALKRRVAKK